VANARIRAPEEKLRPELASRAAAVAPHERLEVVIELTPVAVPEGSTRKDRIAAVRSAFDQEADLVRQAITQAGGTVTGEAWLNQTVRAELPRHALLGIAAHRSVVAIDAPYPLQAEDAVNADG
jgi:hypothetical protein